MVTFPNAKCAEDDCDPDDADVMIMIIRESDEKIICALVCVCV